MYKRYCDRCGKEIPPREGYLNIQMGLMIGQYNKGENQETDICSDCYEKFKFFMANRDQNVVPSYKSVIRDPVDVSL